MERTTGVEQFRQAENGPPRLAEQVELCCNPVVQAMYHADFSGAEQALAETRASYAVGSGIGDEALAEAVQYQLDYLQFHLEKAQRGQPDDALLESAKAALSRPALHPSAAALRDRLYLQLRTSAERAGQLPLPEMEFADCFSRVPAEQRTQEFWHFVAGWAFEHCRLDLLEQAYEELLVRRDDFVPDWTWQRVHLFYRLTSGGARRQDVALLLDLCRLRPQLLEFRRYIWPRCEEAGLVDEELRQLLSRRLTEAGLS